MTDDGAVESVIGEGTTVDGSFRSEHPIRIRGTVQGEVQSTHRVLVEAGAKVQAKVIAHEVVIAGEVNGEVACSGRVELRATGRVTGEISARVVAMAEGAYFEGHLEMPSGGAGRQGGLGLDALKPLVAGGSPWRQAESGAAGGDDAVGAGAGGEVANGQG